MNHIDYFKLQAKNLFKDFKEKTQKRFSDDAEFIVGEYGFGMDDFSLMKAQHIIALMGGFDKWADLARASKPKLEVAKLLFDNRSKVNVEEWNEYIWGIKQDHSAELDPEDQLLMLKQIWLRIPPQEGEPDIRPEGLEEHLDQMDKNQIQWKNHRSSPDAKFISLPLSKADRAALIEEVNYAFESVILRAMPRDPAQVRKLWNVEDFVDNALTPDMLPISREYASHLMVDVFLVHHVLGLAAQGDQKVEQP
jgi:hypothetical protein